jgi:hypothetical protein
MKQTDWPQVAIKLRELFPDVVQIASYSRKRWLLVFETEPDKFLNTFHPLIKVIRKFRLLNPLIVNKNFIQTSLDCYPLEFLDIQSDYINHYAAEDVIAELQFNREDIRRQIEREIKSKWLHTRLSSLRLTHMTFNLYRLLRISFNSLLPVFKGFCFLQDGSVPKETDKLLDGMEDILHMDVKVLRYIAAQKKAPSRMLMANLFNDYIRLLTLCGEKIDGWTAA